MTAQQRAAIEQLRDGEAPKRESAANKLRRKPCPEAGPALFEALEAELEGRRSWGVMDAQAWALAANPHPPALERLLEIAGEDLGGTAVNDSVGGLRVIECLESPLLADGLVERLLALAEEAEATEYDPERDKGWEASLAAARELA